MVTEQNVTEAVQEFNSVWNEKTAIFLVGVIIIILILLLIKFYFARRSGGI